jgi:hypothetical protein
MKRKRDIQGKFTLKDKDYRQVRCLSFPFFHERLFFPCGQCTSLLSQSI